MKVRKRRKKERGVAVKDNTSFYSRWSQRKAEQQTLTEEALEEVPLESIDSASIPSDANLDPNVDNSSLAVQEDAAPALTDEDMPDVETLTKDSDFNQFFSPGVSEELRKLALRKLFFLPEFNIRDGLNDYDDDFSKMPELTKAVVDKLRSWVNDKQEDLEEELGEQLSVTTNDETKEPQPDDLEPAQERSKAPHPSQHLDLDYSDESDLGDADLDG